MTKTLSINQVLFQSYHFLLKNFQLVDQYMKEANAAAKHSWVEQVEKAERVSTVVKSNIEVTLHHL